MRVAFTAVYLQLVDSTITVVAHKHGWDPAPHRLPTDWFRAEQSSPDIGDVPRALAAIVRRVG